MIGKTVSAVFAFCSLLLACAASGQGSVEIVKVHPSKILYEYNEKAAASILVVNRSDSVQKGRLVASEEWDVAESRELWSSPLELAPKEERKLNFEWNVGDWMYGHGLRVKFLQDSKTMADAVEFYQVADPKQWFRCVLINSGPLDIPNKHVAQGWRYAQGLDTHDPFLTYSNYRNWFAYALCDFFKMAPEAEQWLAGQSGYDMRKDLMLKQIAHDRSVGIRSGAYTQGPSGPYAWELARQHPEFLVRSKTGAFVTAFGELDPVKLSKGKNDGKALCAVGPCLIFDSSNPEVLRLYCDSMVKAIKMFSWDAVYFDGLVCACEEGVTWDKRQVGGDAVSARNVRTVQRIVRESYPDIPLWWSGVAPYKHTHLRDTKLATLQDSHCGMLKEIQSVQICSPSNSYHQWRNLYECCLNERDAVHKAEGLADPVLIQGYIYTPWPSKEEKSDPRYGWTWTNHVGTLMLATRFHPAVGESEGFRPTCQFATRYSALLWAKGIQPVKDPSRVVKVESNRELWWEECVYQREGKGYRDTLLNLVNSPMTDEAVATTKVDPETARHVEVEYNLKGKGGKVRAWVMQPYLFDAKRKEPSVVELTPEVDGQRVFLELPPITYYALVVIREVE